MNPVNKVDHLCVCIKLTFQWAQKDDIQVKLKMSKIFSGTDKSP